jgi:hypothetical protein
MAELNRERIESDRMAKLQLAAAKGRDVTERQAQKLTEQVDAMKSKQHKANALREAHLQMIVGKAESENNKVEEVCFINNLTIENMKAEIRHRLDRVRLRREARLEDVRIKADVQLEVGTSPSHPPPALFPPLRFTLSTTPSTLHRLLSFDTQAANRRRKEQEAEAASERFSALQRRLEAVEERRIVREEEVQRRQSRLQRKTQEAGERRRALQQTGEEDAALIRAYSCSLVHSWQWRR